MLNLSKPSPRNLFHKSLIQYRDLVDQIEQINTKPYSYTNFCVKRQIEIELLDLSIILANTVSSVFSAEREIISHKDSWPITLVNQTVKPLNYRSNTLNFYESLRSDLVYVRRALVLPQNRQAIADYQKFLYHTYFPEFAKYPFMSTEIFWRILNHIYTYPKTLRVKLPSSYYHRTYLSMEETKSFYSNQGELYADYFD